MTPMPDDPANTNNEQPFEFAEEEPRVPGGLSEEAPWKVMVVDDDDGIHTISRVVLRDFVFENRSVELIGAHSGGEARALIAAHPDTAVILLDVVMETDNAGLDVVRHVREVLKNRFVRIVLRTGQPGQAPERSVVIEYDINDYKEKTELTAQKLVTTVVSALRSYRDIRTIEASRHGLEQIIAASRSLFEPQSLAQFSAGVLEQLGSLLRLGRSGLLAQTSGFTAKCGGACTEKDFRIVAAHGNYAECVGRQLTEAVPAEVLARVAQARAGRGTFIDHDSFVGSFRASNGFENLVYVQTGHPITALDAKLLDVFAINIGIAFDNVHLNEELAETQAEIIHTLAEVVETRSNETGRHVHRVGAYSRLLGELAGLSGADCDLLAMTAPMHDIGKIGIPDDLLNKPGRFTAEEFARMQHHAALGHHLLGTSRRPALRSAALIAHQHHERWDGTGYPDGLAGEAIHIFAHIVAIADVFDALCHARVYKAAWGVDDAIAYIAAQAGAQFDPRLVEAFLAHRHRFLEILDANPDAAALPAKTCPSQPLPVG